MEHRFDVARALGELATRADAWRFIRDFAAGWATPITEDDGVTDEELDRAHSESHAGNSSMGGRSGAARDRA